MKMLIEPSRSSSWQAGTTKKTMENKPESANTQEALFKLGGIVTKAAPAILIQ